MRRELTRLRGELLSRFQVRKSVAQKAAFAEWACAYAREQGFASVVERSGRFVDTRNIVIGDVTRAQTLITAHYDTCARLPFPNVMTPQCWPVILLTQIVLPVLVFVSLGAGAGYLLGKGLRLMRLPAGLATLLCSLLVAALMAGLIALMLCGPANPNTANDNTSGVALLLLVLRAFAGRSDVAFVLFDNEEKGLIGSSAFAKRHPRAARRAFVVNLDCVSDGDTLLYACSKAAMKSEQAKRIAAMLEETAPRYGKRGRTGVFPGTLYPSDQMAFQRGTAFAALKGKRILYLDRIHTIRDTEFDEDNLLCLLEVLRRGLEKTA